MTEKAAHFLICMTVERHLIGQSGQMGAEFLENKI
jgi:hypothetical protein